ncbi:HTH domain-containing protein [Granulicella sp. 5B5]|uniref:HTH domain-containing protein n=1 Tax=Granulicella sp. 5B5 TaxID=1617967 RepID=UPI0015F661B7|nr:HTH domain-containing protein [Granulicella sp. 5B5]
MATQMSWREAAIEVLKDKPEGMLYTEITQQIIDRGLRTKLGATPDSSLNTTLSESIRWDGANTPFERIGPGRYRLRSTSAGALPSAVPPALASLEAEEIEEKKETTGLINAFGMFWSREKVQWATSTINLFGKRDLRSDTVDFSDQRGVYLLYDRGEVIYVGRAIDRGIGVRLREHVFDRLSGRWDRFSWFGVYKVSDNGSLNSSEQNYDRGLLIATMEALLIEAVEPRQNRRGGDRFSAVEFIQVEDPEIEKAKRKAVLADLQAKL